MTLLNRFIKSIFTPHHAWVIFVAGFIMITGNVSFFRHITEIYPLSLANIPFLLSLFAFFLIALNIFLLLVCYHTFAKWVLALMLILSAMAAYFMDSYNVVLDVVMIDNIFHTDTKEAAGYFNIKFLLNTTLFGILPAWYVIKKYRVEQFPQEIKSKVKALLIWVFLLVLVVIPFTEDYAVFVREHKVARTYANPLYYVYSSVLYVKDLFKTSGVDEIQQVATDTKRIEFASKHELIILVVGETARFDRFSLNGYSKETNPLLKQEQVISFDNVSSCGTSTGVSVPCMFSIFHREDFDREKALHFENLLDVLVSHDVQVLWRDNNSNSKGVATRVKYENFQTPTLNPVCDNECRDIGMLHGLDEYIAQNRNKDMFIVLHQMGNHGPEYYRRYPNSFEKFSPTCKSSRLSECTQQEIDNAYDNAILYTDYFLANVIGFLKKYDGEYETAMLYVSDHGESLGEHGVYLHAAPYVVAPKEQTHVPVVLWMGNDFDFKLEQITPYKNYPLTQTDLFCSVLAGFELEAGMCSKSKELFYQNIDLIKEQKH